MSLSDHVAFAIGVASQCVIAGAGAFAIYTMVATIRPRWQRMKRLMAGHIEPEVAAPPVFAVRYRSHDAAAAPLAPVSL